jgi:phage terminase small subunit
VTKNELSPRQRRFVAAMLTARTVREAAESVGVSERTGLKYLADPKVKAALSAALDGALGDATRATVGAMREAVATLEAIHGDEAQPAGSRVAAARAILEAGPRLREALDLAARVADLEQRIAEGGQR